MISLAAYVAIVSRRNVGWVATCNTVGQTAGYFVGNVMFLTLESADFCNKYIYTHPETHGVVTLSGSLLRILSRLFAILKFWLAAN